MDRQLSALGRDEDHHLEHVPGTVRADDEPAVWVPSGVLDGERMVNGVTDVFVDDAVLASRRVDPRKNLVYYENAGPGLPLRSDSWLHRPVLLVSLATCARASANGGRCRKTPRFSVSFVCGASLVSGLDNGRCRMTAVFESLVGSRQQQPVSVLEIAAEGLVDRHTEPGACWSAGRSLVRVFGRMRASIDAGAMPQQRDIESRACRPWARYPGRDDLLSDHR